MITLAMKLKRMGFMAKPDPIGEVEYIGWHELPYTQNVNSQTITIKQEHRHANYFIFYVMHSGQGVTCPNATLMDVARGAFSPNDQHLAVFKAISGTGFDFTFTSTSERAWVGYAAFKGENIGYLGAGDNFGEVDIQSNLIETKNSSGVSLAAMSQVYENGPAVNEHIISSSAAGGDTRVAVALFSHDILGKFQMKSVRVGRTAAKHSLNLYSKKSSQSSVQFLGYHETDPVRTGTSISIGIQPEHQNADYILIFVQTRSVRDVTSLTSDYIEDIDTGDGRPTKTWIYKAHAGVVSHTFTFSSNTLASMIGYAAFSGKNINYSSAKMNNKTQHSNYVEATTMTSEQGVNIALMMKRYSRSSSAGDDKAVAPYGTTLKSRASNKENQWLLFSLAIADGNKIEGAWEHGVRDTNRNAAATMAINLRN